MSFYTRPNFEDRQVVQYTGTSITLSGDTNINQLGNFRIQKDASPGLVATSLDFDGTVVWGPLSGISWSVSACTSPLYVNNLVACPSSGGTIQVDSGNLALNSELNFLISLSAGTNTDEVLVIDGNGYVKAVPNLMGIGYFTGGTGSCITDLYVTNIHGCSPINIQPISSDDVYMVMGGGKVGIGTSSPSYSLTVSGISNTTSGFVVGDELGGYVQSGYHKVQIVADGTKTPLVIQGGSGAVEIWKDTSPTAAASLGMNVPGFSGTSDFVFASYNGSNWAETVRITNNGNVGINNENPSERLHVSGNTIVNSNYVMLSDALTTIPVLNFKGFINSQDYDEVSGFLSYNTNVSGSSAMFLFNDSLVGGSLGVGGSQLVRPGSPVDGINFYQNKIVLRGNSLSDGMVFNPNSGNLSGTFWWEFAGISGMILKGNGVDKAYLGLALNPDGTEMPTSSLQIGGTGTTGTFQYKDGNQQNGYVLTSDSDGNATWQASTGGGGGTGINPYYDLGSQSLSITWDVSGNSINYEVTLTGNTDLDLINVRNGDYGTLIVSQDSVGGRTIMFNTVNGSSTSHRVINGGGGSPTLTATANAIDILSFTYNGSIMFWTVGNDYT